MLSLAANQEALKAIRTYEPDLPPDKSELIGFGGAVQ
jgi:hypothetical protein